MLVINIPTSDEILLLSEHRKKSHTVLIRDRTHAVLLYAKAYDIHIIADILDRSVKTIRSWISAWNTHRISSIFPAYTGNNNATKLTRQQRKEIQETLAKPPADTDVPVSFWSVKKLATYLSAHYGVVYESERSYHHILSVSGYSFKKPEGQNRRRDDVLVTSRMHEIYAEITEKRIAGYELFAVDECSLCFETILRKAWIKKGKKTIVKTESDRQRQHYFGSLNCTITSRCPHSRPFLRIA